MNQVYKPHYSVLKKECIDFLTENANDPNQNYCFADLTFGGGGHSLELLKKSSNFQVISVDQDPDALKNGQHIIEQEGLSERITLLSMNFSKFWEHVKSNNNAILKDQGGFQGILMDLGVSSHHFDEDVRGFSFKKAAPLDMRMNNLDNSIPTAADIIAKASEEELSEIFFRYGEERFAGRIAKKIVEQRSSSPILTTSDLENIIFHCYPKKFRYGRTNPSTKCFQALRIAVNSELDVLSSSIPNLISLLKSGGRLAIISFHSLEDRIVKKIYKSISQLDNVSVKILTKKPVVPSEEEITINSRSRSAKLRVIEKL
ncbi:MAG: 16S rRNA (cytosine(1402)-N(4))-methyltransferase RsmH [Bacteriovoracaceae bacterium]|nr:16S rRNA (cytosine(1402)-N(4))-methyltransferase RsmH [Bacteriovoracaceae bacterium]